MQDENRNRPLARASFYHRNKKLCKACVVWLCFVFCFKGLVSKPRPISTTQPLHHWATLTPKSRGNFSGGHYRETNRARFLWIRAGKELGNHQDFHKKPFGFLRKSAFGKMSDRQWGSLSKGRLSADFSLCLQDSQPLPWVALMSGKHALLDSAVTLKNLA